jgi:L-fuculose-phosphate aldolase
VSRYDAAMDLARASDALIRAGRRLGDRGLIAAGEGNLSIRLDADRLLVTPTGRRKDELDPSDLVVVWLGHPERESSSPSGLAPTSDLAIHLAIYAARPDIGAVAHAHLPASMALTLAGERPDPTALPETAFHLPRLPVVAFGEMGSAELATRIAAALSEGPEPFADAAILERHGAEAVGRDVDQAVDRLELVEVLCRAWRDSILIRAARVGLGIV